MSSSSQRTLVILDERGAAARLPSQIASLVQGYRIIHLSDTRHAPYCTLSRVSAARLVLLCIDLVRGYGISSVLLASAAAARAALPAVRIGCARAGIALHEGASLAAREVVRRHRFGDVAVLGGEIVDERAVAEALAEAGLSARTRSVPLDLASLGEAGADALGRLVEAQRTQVGTYVLGSSEAARVADLIRRSDPDAEIVEADAALAAEVAVALEAEPPADKAASTVIRCATEASEHWQARIAELAGVAPDAVAGRWVMPAGPSEGPFAVAMDEDGEPFD